MPGVPPPPPMDAGEKRLLGLLGFQDTNGNGVAETGEQRTYKKEGFQSNQDAAFRFLAAAGDNRYDAVIDGTDFRALHDRRVLAHLLREDPEYRDDILRCAVLKEGKRETPQERYHQDGIPPVAYGRLMTYIQLAYGLLFPSGGMAVNGRYDAPTAAATRKFQKSATLLTEGRDGTFVDRSTLGVLILHLEHQPDEMLQTLQTLEQSRRSFFVNAVYGEGRDAATQLVLALQYFYPAGVPPYLKADSHLARQAAVTFLSEEFGADLIGPVTLGRIIADIEARE